MQNNSMNSTALSFPKVVETLDSSYNQSSEYFVEGEPPLHGASSAWEQLILLADSFGESGLVPDFCGPDPLYGETPWRRNFMPCLEFNDLDDICDDFGLWAWDINESFVDNKPLINEAGGTTLFDQPQQLTYVENSDISSCIREFSEERLPNGRFVKSSGLQLEEIRKYFDVPITKAAKELKVGLTVLKKRCRELNIMRWPHRKIKSLKSLIENAKELGLTNEIGMLEEHKRMLHSIPEMELTERTKKLRQACFKANYKKRRALLAAAPRFPF